MSDPIYDAYCQSLGNLILRYARLEQDLFRLLGTMAGLSWPMAAALVGDLGIDAGMVAVKRILVARSLEDNEPNLEKELAANVTYIFQQISRINAVRNQIVHNGVLPPRMLEAPISSNRMRAKSAAKLKEMPISKGDLDKMSEDVTTTLELLKILWLMVTPPPTQVPPNFYEDALKQLAQTVTARPWLYKPASQNSQKT